MYVWVRERGRERLMYVYFFQKIVLLNDKCTILAQLLCSIQLSFPKIGLLFPGPKSDWGGVFLHFGALRNNKKAGWLHPIIHGLLMNCSLFPLSIHFCPLQFSCFQALDFSLVLECSLEKYRLKSMKLAEYYPTKNSLLKP